MSIMANRANFQQLFEKVKEKKRIEVEYEGTIYEADINMVTFGPMRKAMMKGADTNNIETTKELIKAATGFTDEQIDLLPFPVLEQMSEQITKISGLDKVSQKKAENFPDPQKAN